MNNTGVLADYNGHGTHCAGIAAATGYNGMGIIGANPFARIMPITAMQSNGSGDVGTIIKAVDYAAANGADVISMSLGTYGESPGPSSRPSAAHIRRASSSPPPATTATASTTPIPRRASWPHAPCSLPPTTSSRCAGRKHKTTPSPRSPTTTMMAPRFSAYGEEKLYNHEITVPGGEHHKHLSQRQLPPPQRHIDGNALVAGAVSRLLMSKSVENKEEFFGDLINACKGGVLDIYAAYKTSDADRRPELQLVTVRSTTARVTPTAASTPARPYAYPMLRNSWATPAISATPSKLPKRPTPSAR